ncbi:MAG: DUF1730 domain-containing protein [Caldilineaceae bacterium]
MAPLHARSQSIKAKAQTLGFDLCAITAVDAAPHADFFGQWVAAGRAGEMDYLARNFEKRRDPRLLTAPTASPPRSLIVVGVSHYQFALPAELRDDPSRGIIASYAWGEDYHEIMRPLLYALDEFIREQSGRTTPGKCLSRHRPRA